MDGVVGRAAAAKWHFGKGAAAAAAADHEGALASFRGAAALGHEGTAIQIEGVEIATRLRALEMEAEAFRRRAAEAGSDVSHFWPAADGAPASLPRPRRRRRSGLEMLRDSVPQIPSRRRPERLIERLQMLHPAPARLRAVSQRLHEEASDRQQRLQDNASRLAQIQQDVAQVRNEAQMLVRNISGARSEEDLIRLDDSSDGETTARRRDAEVPPEDTHP